MNIQTHTDRQKPKAKSQKPKAKSQKPKAKKEPITKERFSVFHIEKHQLNKTCGEILTEVDYLAKTYRHNKHNNKDVSSVCLFDRDWKKLISSLNVYAKKELRKIIETDCLIYQGIKLRPKNINADN